MKRTKTTNPELIQVIRYLRKQSKETHANIWRDVSERLAKPRRNRTAVNLSSLARHSGPKETVVVPGKVLGSGTISHRVNVAALSFSEKAKQKILAARGKPMSLLQLAKKNPKGTNIKLIG